jgi:non-canonical (house-cleaning) NTP pyrophosphatase
MIPTIKNFTPNVNLNYPSSNAKTMIVYVGSHNVQKLQACWDFMFKFEPTYKHYIYGVNVESGIPNQPIGELETSTGSSNRLKALVDYLTVNKIPYDYAFAYENGLIEYSDKMWNDVCYLSVHRFSNDTTYYGNSKDELVPIPNNFVTKCLEFGQEKTIGEIIQETTSIDKVNFHQFYSINKKTRTQIMAQIPIDISKPKYCQFNSHLSEIIKFGDKEIEIDCKLVPLITRLNKKKLITRGSCENWSSLMSEYVNILETKPQAYIIFEYNEFVELLKRNHFILQLGSLSKPYYALNELRQIPVDFNSKFYESKSEIWISWTFDSDLINKLIYKFNF